MALVAFLYDWFLQMNNKVNRYEGNTYGELFSEPANAVNYYLKDCEITGADWQTTKSTEVMTTSSHDPVNQHESHHTGAQPKMKRTTQPMRRRMLNTEQHSSDVIHEGTGLKDEANPPQAHTHSLNTVDEQEIRHSESPGKKQKKSARKDAKKIINKVVFIGPSSAGKTAILCSLKQAIEHLDHDKRYHVNRNEESFSFHIDESQEGKTLTELLRSFRRGIIKKKASTVQPTDRVNQFTFQISTRSGYHLKCSTLDGKGGSLFVDDDHDYDYQKYSDQRQSILENAATADTIVLCIDASKIMNEYHQQMIQTIISEIIYVQNKQRGDESAESHLNVSSFVLLLTKIDCLAERAYHEILVERDHSSGVTPESIADFIDPVEQARESIGKQEIESILNKLTSKAKLYIGMTSAWGFDAYGYPIAGKNGLFRYWIDPKNKYRPVDKEPSEDEYPHYMKNYRQRRTFDDWRPYGIQDLIFFLMFKEKSRRFLEVTKSDLRHAGPINTEMFPENLTHTRK